MKNEKKGLDNYIFKISADGVIEKNSNLLLLAIADELSEIRKIMEKMIKWMK